MGKKDLDKLRWINRHVCSPRTEVFYGIIWHNMAILEMSANFLHVGIFENQESLWR